MTIKIKIILVLTLLNIILFKFIIPVWCIIQILLSIGESNFYSIFVNNALYIILAIILDFINIPSHFLNTKDKQWLADEAMRIKNKNKNE